MNKDLVNYFEVLATVLQSLKRNAKSKCNELCPSFPIPTEWSSSLKICIIYTKQSSSPNRQVVTKACKLPDKRTALGPT